ncbi:MAG: hypothetical protein IJI56_05235 [Firmicutes bacterium]|nr:hypothetical protein [Bacillota bacterium]
MKKFISLLSLYIYSPMKKALAAIIVASGFGILHTWLMLSGKLTDLGGSLFVREWIGEGAVFGVTFWCFLFLFSALADNPANSSGRSAYTIERMGFSEAGLYWTNALADLIYLLLFHFALGLSSMGRIALAEKYGALYAGPQGIYLDIINDVLESVAFPMYNTTLKIAIPLLIVTAALVSAAISQGKRRSQTQESM